MLSVGFTWSARAAGPVAGFVDAVLAWLMMGGGDGGDVPAGGVEDDQLRAGALGQRLRPG